MKVSTSNDTIDRWFFEIDLEAVATESRMENGIDEYGDPEKECCFLCGKLLKSRDYFVHYMVSGNLISTTQDIGDDSQGFFAVGSECARKLPNIFVFPRAMIGV